MNFSIIIINYNTFEYTKNCLDSIFKNLSDGNFEIIVVDNASPDGSGKRLREIYQNKVKFILNPKNSGFGAANNLAAKMAQGDFLWFLNSDTLINKVDLNEIKNIFVKNEKLGVVSLDLLLENQKRQGYAYGDFLSIRNLLKRLSNVGKDFGDCISVDWVSGASMIIRKDLFHKLGGFDENFFMYFEDMDLCWRIKKRGYLVWFLKNYSIIHFGGKSSTDFRKMKRDYYISQDYFFKKHHGYFSLAIVKFLRSIYLLVKTQ